MSTDADSGARGIQFGQPDLSKKGLKVRRTSERGVKREERREERQRDKKRRQAERSKQFRKNQPMWKQLSGTIAGISEKKESTNGTSYSPGPSSFDTAIGNLIDSLTQRRGSK